jgi:hypothetical protein
VPLIHDDYVIKAFLPDDANHTLGIGIGVRRPVWCFNYLKSLALEDLIEFTAEFAVPVLTYAA